MPTIAKPQYRVAIVSAGHFENDHYKNLADTFAALLNTELQSGIPADEPPVKTFDARVFDDFDHALEFLTQPHDVWGRFRGTIVFLSVTYITFGQNLAERLQDIRVVVLPGTVPERGTATVIHKLFVNEKNLADIVSPG